MFDVELTVVAHGAEIGGWSQASIDSDVLTPADAFSLSRPYDDEAFGRLPLDTEVQILVNGAPVLTGFVEERSGDYSTMTISGYDKIKRLLAESAPLVRFGGKSLADVAGELVAPWFDRVTLSNTRNRDLLRGRGNKARARGGRLLDEPTDPRKSDPGDCKWGVLEELLERAGNLAWSSGDGNELVIAAPNYDQEAQHSFTVTGHDANCRRMRYRESNANRYALIVAAGTGYGDDANHGDAIRGRVGMARDNPASPDGTGIHFTRPKRLLMPVEARSIAECERLAQREQAKRESLAFEVEIEAYSWGEVRGSAPTLYAYDVVIEASSVNTPIDGLYYVIGRSFQRTRDDEYTVLRAVPIGVELV
ncbi:MAG: hypothetical protein MJE77_11015 [Proteobacteria bacterium]|nr:hypothetical protein [Pseudomonadota bacterium]